MQRGELRVKPLDHRAILAQQVALEAPECLEDPLGRGGPTLTLFRIEREALDAAAGHGSAPLPLEQSIDEERGEVKEEEGLDAAAAVQEDRDPGLDGLE